MKQNSVTRATILTICTFLILSFSLPIKSKNLIGKWEIYKIQKANKEPIQKRKKYIELAKDGTLQGGSIGEAPDKIGTWLFNKKSNMLTLASEKGRRDDGDYYVEKLTKKELILIKDSTYIYLDKAK